MTTWPRSTGAGSSTRCCRREHTSGAGGAGANVRRVAPIAQEGRCRIVLLQNFQRDLVKLPRAHTRDDGLPQRLMDTCHNPARLTHDLNLTRALEDRLGPLLLAPDGATLFLGSTFEYTH